MWGVDLDVIARRFGREYVDHFAAEAQPHVDAFRLEQKENTVILTDEGKLLADSIASDLFKA
jgi:oxygen-independent coproporphyrinogen-3 oxidase